MPRVIELTGMRFGRLTVVERAGIVREGKKGGAVRSTWLCKCDCGKEIVTDAKSLKTSHTTSCGCLAQEARSKPKITTPDREERIILRNNWCGIIQRCYNPKHKEYHRYGGRGITVCEEWRYRSKAFVEWALTNGFKKGLTIDRIDNDGNYEPSNCRYITRADNARNTCKSNFITIEGVTLCQTTWSILAYGCHSTLYKRKKKLGDAMAIENLKTTLKQLCYARE